MFDLEDLIGKVVTIRSVYGNEYVATLMAQTSDGILMVKAPQSVIVEDGHVGLVSFSLTSDAELVPLQEQHIFSIMPTAENVAQGYHRILADK